MPDVEQHHGEKHEASVEDVEVDLVAQERAVVALRVFRDTEDGSDHDEDRSGVENVKEAGPGDVDGGGARSRVAVNAHVEDAGDDDKEAEEEDLDNQTADDDVVARLYCGLGLGLCEHAAACLSQSVRTVMCCAVL